MKYLHQPHNLISINVKIFKTKATTNLNMSSVFVCSVYLGITYMLATPFQWQLNLLL